MITKTALAGLALTALALSGCGGGTADAPGSAAPGASSSASSTAGGTDASSAPSPAESTPASSPSASTAAGTPTDPCKVLDADKIKDLTGLEVKKGTSQSVSSSSVCTWLPDDGTDDDSAVISAQEGPLPGSLSQVEDQLKQEFGGSVTKLSVSGADDARYITGKKSGLNVIDVLAQRDGVFYQVLIAAPRDVSKHKSGAIKVAEALISA